MKGRPPIVPIALLIVLAAVAVSVYLSNQPRPAPPPKGSEEESPRAQEPQPEPAERPEEMDLAATRRLTTAEGQDYIRSFLDRVEDASSVVVRIRFQLSHRIESGPIEGWTRYDSLGRDFCRLDATALQPKVKGKLRGEWEVQKVHGASVTPEGMRKIEYREHRVYDTVFSSTNAEMGRYIEAFRKQADAVFENPLHDLLIDIPLEDRLREVIQATVVKTSEGEEVQIVSRITRPMIEAFARSELRRVFPHLDREFGSDVALRTDTFDPETGVLRKTVYSNIERKELVAQHFTEIGLGVEIPLDRFELELPEPANIADINEAMEKKLERGLRFDDWKKAKEEGTDPLQMIQEATSPPEAAPSN